MFVDVFDSSEMSVPLWNKLNKCFLSQTERKLKTAKTFIISDFDQYNQLGEKPNSKSINDYLAIFLPLNLPLDFSSILSYSVFCGHSMMVTRNGSLLGIGDNRNSQNSSFLTKIGIIEFSIKNYSSFQLAPISSFCCAFGILYMFSKSGGDMRQLVY